MTNIEQDIKIDEAYANGLQAGWNMALNDNGPDISVAINSRRKEIVEAKRKTRR